MLFKNARKTQNLHDLRGKLKQNVIFCVQNFFKIVLFKNIFFFQIVLFKNLFFCRIVLFKEKFPSKSCFLSFQILAEVLSMCYQLVGLWLCVKKFFLRVCDMCLPQVWYNLFAYCLLYGNWILGGCDDYIICNTNWFLQISLDFEKWLVYKVFILKDTTSLS